MIVQVVHLSFVLYDIIERLDRLDWSDRKEVEASYQKYSNSRDELEF